MVKISRIAMKMLSRIFIALTTMLLGAVSVSTYAARLCKDPETLPAFVGGLLDEIGRAHV